MKVVNPNLQINNISFIPRFSSFSPLINVNIINESTKDETEFLQIPQSLVNGLASVNLDFSFNEGDKYDIKIFTTFNSIEVIAFRGRIFATIQEAQDYNITKDLYIYE